MNLKHRIRKLADKVMPESKFCICPGFTFLTFENDKLKCVEICEQCGKQTKILTWAEMTKISHESEESENRVNLNWKNYTDEA